MAEKNKQKAVDKESVKQDANIVAKPAYSKGQIAELKKNRKKVK